MKLRGRGPVPPRDVAETAIPDILAEIKRILTCLEEEKMQRCAQEGCKERVKALNRFFCFTFVVYFIVVLTVCAALWI